MKYHSIPAPRLIQEDFLTAEERNSPIALSFVVVPGHPCQDPIRGKIRDRGGVYRIVHMESGKIYVGSAVKILRRWEAHRWELNNNRHHSRHLQSAWNKFGAAAFRFECIELISDVTALHDREQFWLDRLRTYERELGYNNRTIAQNNMGYVASAETRKKLSEAAKGRKASAETRRKMSIAQSGLKRRPRTAEQLIAHSLAHKGIKCSSEARARMAQGQINRAPFTEEHRKSLSSALLGRRRSAAECEKLSIGHMGLTASAATRAKMSESQKNRRLREASGTP